MAVHDAARRASSTTTAPPLFAPVALNRPAVGARSALKVAVFNAHGGSDLDAIAACLSRPPLADAGTLLVCEASWRMRRHGRIKFAAELAAALGMSFVFIPSFGRHEAGGAFRGLGNAILCARPLEDLRPIPLPNPSPRAIVRRMPGVPTGLVARITVGIHRLTLSVVHLERRWDPAGRALQMELFLGALGAAAPAVIGGDFNTTTMDMSGRLALARATAAIIAAPKRFRNPEPSEPLFERLSEHGFAIEGANVPHAPTFTPSRIVPPLWRPKLDWLAARGLEPLAGSAAVVAARASALGRRVSDHDFVLCEFHL